jgi:hypothetical protein
MAENKFSYKEFTVQPLSGSVSSIDLRPGIIGMEYFEDILSPTITAKIVFSATEVLGPNGPQEVELFGGESVSFDIEVPSFQNLDITEHGMCVRKISADKSGRQGLYVLELVSKESLSNETSRVVKRFNKPISESVREIIQTLKTTKPIKVDPTFNNYNFIGNTRRPFDLVTWLCPKSVPSDNGTPGFFFYETQDGYNFLSANNLLKGGGGQYSQIYSQKENRENPGDPKNNFKILKSNIAKNNDIMLSLRLGMYANNSIYYSLWDNKYSSTKFTLKQEYNKKIQTSSGSSPAPKLPQGLEDYPSRYIVRALDAGNLTEAGKLEKDQNLPKYQAISTVRYSLLYSQVLNIIIPCNPELKAGQLIEIEIPRPSSKENKDTESTASGKYVIASLCHRFDQNRKAFTSLSLIKDSYEYVTT